MKRQKHAYLLRVAHSLGACQLVEFELKFYLTRAFELIKKAVGGKIAFTMTGEDFDDAPLGRLIDMFGKLSDCPALVRRLNEFKKRRNFVAHRAIVTCLDHEGGLDSVAAEKMKTKLAEIEMEATELTEAIHEESLKFVAHLYFEYLDEKG